MSAQETSLAFVERMESVEIPSHSVLISREDFLHLRQIAKTAALIEVHRMDIIPTHEKKFTVFVRHTVNDGVSEDDLNTAVRAVADKIKAGNHG